MMVKHGDSPIATPAGTSEQVRTRGIPTLFHDVLFRSRLEAKWAAMLDRWGWHWEYEAHDLAGYVPDFVVHLHRPLLVEVKALPDEYKAAQDKINASGWEGEALIVSSTIVGSTIGRFGELESAPDGFSSVWHEARVYRCLNYDHISVLPEDGDWTCRVCGCGRGLGNAHVGEYDPAADWAWATNRVQWRAA